MHDTTPTTAKHTAELWSVREDHEYPFDIHIDGASLTWRRWAYCTKQVSLDQCMAGTYMGGTRGAAIAGNAEQIARALRLVACVNACAGIPDPAAALDLARGALSASLSGYINWHDGEPKEMCERLRTAISALTPKETP